MINVNGVINLNKPCERADDQAAAALVVYLGDLLFLVLVKFVGHGPNPPIALQYFKFQFWVKNEHSDFTFVFLFTLRACAHNQVVTAFVLLNGQGDDHVLYSHGLTMLKRPSHPRLLQLMDLQFFRDQAENCYVVRLIVFHADRVSLLFILLFPCFMRTFLILLHFDHNFV